MARYYIKKDSRNEYFWILKSNNGETVCKSSESYESKQGVKVSIKWNQDNGKTTNITDSAEQ